MRTRTGTRKPSINQRRHRRPAPFGTSEPNGARPSVPCRCIFGYRTEKAQCKFPLPSRGGLPPYPPRSVSVLFSFSRSSLWGIRLLVSFCLERVRLRASLPPYLPSGAHPQGVAPSGKAGAQKKRRIKLPKAHHISPTQRVLRTLCSTGDIGTRNKSDSHQPLQAETSGYHTCFRHFLSAGAQKKRKIT